ncbi:response regulator receiver sensor signal transduction histidine kinase [Calothrix sp. NIES-2100]|uniref:hybrid sensor histidine kinase/response regulator n=1 Tax=Calothrix sp. NIES-2100 TaxID=1954172 RepID=UPI000B60FBF9|nr:response regulator receiver sensor signal transduction histidine kinase [Calothrix sp. NIES-2100]
MKAKILVVENEMIIAYDIKACLEKAGYTVPAMTAYGEQAITKAAELHPDLVLMDVILKGKISGIEAAAEIGNRFNIPVVYLTAYTDHSNLEKVKTTQPFGYILKPFAEMQLITTIEIALNKHQTEVMMREALEEEKERQKIKSQFFSMLSHEFRNPLSNILTCTELLTDHSHQLNESKKDEYLNYIQKSVQHLEHLLNDVLLIGKAETVKNQFNPEPLDLEKFCQNLVADIQLTANKTHNVIFKKIGINVLTQPSINPKNPQLISLDEKMVRHILINLLNNAVKYSPEGGTVSFELFYMPGEVIFRIQDEGIGIPDADQENLFTCFQRGSNVGNIPGNGLGLAIVKHYVDLHGGDISFASKLGTGTTFIVNLPVGNN